ncbi:MAG: putative glycoside hydrolase [Polyangiaceae bacterium]
MIGVMRALTSRAFVLVTLLSANAAKGDSFPAGVSYPLPSAPNQPAGLAQPLPSSRRYVLAWNDQLVPDGATGDAAYSMALMQWVVTHYVGTQKLFQSQIDAFRAINPNFLHFTYHTAYDLNGADQSNPVGNITGPNTFGQEDTDTFTPWVNANGVTREDLYQHSSTTISMSTRVSYPDPSWLMNVSNTDWQKYMQETLLSWATFPTTNSTGFFLDVAFVPWYNYSPTGWWASFAGGSTEQDLDTWWIPEALTYYQSLQAAFAKTSSHPRYIVIPNVDTMDGQDEPTFLEGTDGAFTENWQNVMTNSANWNLSIKRICQYATGVGKVWSADSSADITQMPAAQRSMIIGTYLLIRNSTSYIVLLPGLYWYPDYEIDLGGYVDEPPSDIEMLRVAGTGGESGGLYVRQEVAGTILVNSSSAALSYTVPSAMVQAEWSGGGAVSDNPVTEASETLTYTMSVPAGSLSVPALTAIILRSPGGVPDAGVMPGGVLDGGVEAGDSSAATGGVEAGDSSAATGGEEDGATAGSSGGGGSDGGGASSGTSADGGGAGGDAGAATGTTHSSGGCGCRQATGGSRGEALLALVAGGALIARRRRGTMARATLPEGDRR